MTRRPVSHTPAPPPEGAEKVVAHPMTVYQAFIDRLSAINLARDTDAWLDHSEYPYSVHTDLTDKVIETRGEAEAFIASVNALVADEEIDSFVRQADHAEYLAPSLIIGHHTTTLSRRGAVIVGPLLSRMVIRNTTGAWRLISVTNAVSNTDYPYAMPEPSDGLLPEANIRARRMASAQPGTPAHLGLTEDEADAEVIYDAFLTAFTAANVTGDFATWNALHVDRVRKHTPTTETTVETGLHRRGIFDAITKEITSRGGTGLRRERQSAQWSGPGEISGTHLTMILAEGKLAAEQMRGQFILRRTDGAWKLADVTNDRDVDAAPIPSAETLKHRTKPTQP
ncbi:hypothetical protein [Pseudaestuariivita sp.]|uniref:hypothetical protein n=1 Tax=Pseudaestuariivita sp. TaxID=2211669 RepID=UPI0040597C57